MELKSLIPGLGNSNSISSLDDVDDEILDRAVKILEEQDEEVTRENIQKQANYLLEMEQASENELKIGFIQDREEATVTDQTLIAPDKIKEVSNFLEKGHMIRGDDYVRILTVTGFPSQIGPGVLSPLYTSNANIRVTQHIQPRDTSRVLKKAKKKLNRLWAKITRKHSKGKRDTKEEEEDRRTVRQLIWDIITGRTKLFDQSIYIEIVAKDKDTLDRLTKEVINALNGKQLEAGVPKRHQVKAQQSVAPLAKDTLKGSRQLHQETSLATMFPFIEPDVVNPDGVFYGFQQNKDPIFFEPYNLSSYIEIITGKQGSGKTFAKMHELLIRYMKNELYNTYVLDPKADFASLAEELDGEVIELGGDTKVNPLAIQPNAVEGIENPYQDKFRVILAMYNTHFNGELTANHRGTLHRVIRLAYLRYGITEDPETHTNKNPIIEDHAVILSHLKEGRNPTEFMTLDPSVDESQHEEIAQEIKNIEDRISEEDAKYARYLFNGLEAFQEGGPNSNLNGRTNIDLDAPLLVFDMEAYADSNETPLMMHVILDLIYQRCTRSEDKDEVVIDEAHYILDDPHALKGVNLFARHHRHSNTRLSLMSQTASEFITDEKDDGDAREEIYKTADVKRMFYQKTVTDEVAEFHNLTAKERNFIVNASRGQKHGESQCLMEITGLGKIPSTLRVHPYIESLLGADSDPWEYLIENDIIGIDDVDYLERQNELDEYTASIPDDIIEVAKSDEQPTAAD